MIEAKIDSDDLWRVPKNITDDNTKELNALKFGFMSNFGTMIDEIKTY